MNRRKSKLTPLIAARVNTSRRRPSAVEPAAPFLRLCTDGTDTPLPATTQPAAPVQIHTLLTRLQRVIHAAEITECNAVAELRLLQESIDATVDAITAMIARLNQDDRKRLVIGGSTKLLALRTGGRCSLAKTTLRILRKTIDEILTQVEAAFGLNQPLLVDDLLAGNVSRQIAEENRSAQDAALEDADFAVQISRLTQLDVLSQSHGQFARHPKKRSPSILEIDPDA